MFKGPLLFQRSARAGACVNAMHVQAVHTHADAVALHPRAVRTHNVWTHNVHAHPLHAHAVHEDGKLKKRPTVGVLFLLSISAPPIHVAEQILFSTLYNSGLH